MRRSGLVFSCAAFVLVAACGVGDDAPPAIDVVYDADSTDPALDRYVGESLRALRVPAIAAVRMADGEIAWEGYFGVADTRTMQPVDADSRWYLASVSKVVAGAAILRAVEDGALSLDADVTTVVDIDLQHPDAPDTPFTLRQLLTHTAGIRDNWRVIEAAIVEGDSSVSLGDFVRGYLEPDGDTYDRRRNFGAAPGTAFEYSNIGLSFAAWVAGEASTGDFETLSQGAVFDPLGMTSASWRLAGSDLDALTTPHTVRDGAWNPVEHYGYPDYPDGALRVTARDLARFVAGHVGDDTLLQRSTLDDVFTVQDPSIDPDQGLVWARYPDYGPNVWGHEGGDVGIATVALVDVETGEVAVVLMNGDWYDEDLVVEIAGHVLRGTTP